MCGFLEKQLDPLVADIKTPDRWNYTPPGQGDRGAPYAGIKNLGCVCYMISALQQFFMVPCLRYNLLCVDDGKAIDIKEFKGRKFDDNMLHQL
jgi:ubiquitin carboxyl-terminal hydrolase 9/24